MLHKCKSQSQIKGVKQLWPQNILAHYGYGLPGSRSELPVSGLGRKDFKPPEGTLGCTGRVRAQVRDKPGFGPNSDDRAAILKQLI